ncbi:MAG: hypothetical protein KKE44_07900 [Proteobacteria bacterium]|nr:hypothetical protein [Pseudomonadota bacterium]MBU1582650.1 hypothetical protein [Pseudomonadota bacterium]MBU2451730.1 hypothetical protein [Pseudomonadota bacterium]MBU2631059.1 hypothetical protein [Pseudomonadota bacterium]
MNSQSIEFDKIKEDATLPEIVRKSFRVPIEDTKKVWVLIHNKKYLVQDICIGGIGIVLKDNSVFTIDQSIKKCELNIFDISVKNLDGRIVHLSSGPGKELKCGIQWLSMEKETIHQISKIVLTMKQQLLQDNSSSLYNE